MCLYFTPTGSLYTGCYHADSIVMELIIFFKNYVQDWNSEKANDYYELRRSADVSHH